MSKVQFGVTSWESTEVNSKPNANQSNKDLFMRLESGSNVLRIITKPHEYLVHRYKVSESDPGFGERILSSAFHGSDPLIEMGHKPKRRWLVGVIDRKTQSYKILDMSSMVFKGVQELVRDEDWGDPSQYDVDIKVNKSAGVTGYYAVIPKSKKPLTPSDLEIKEQVDLEDLKRRCTPPTPEQVQERVNFLKNRSNGNATANASSAKVNVDVDESDEDFPPVN